MREKALRSVLLLKAIEETDQAGALIPPADRAAATRAAKRAHDASGIPPAGGPLNATALELLRTRADHLLGQVVQRYPFVRAMLEQRGIVWVRLLLIALGLLSGFALSALDGTRVINILSFPLIGLILWNFAIYAIALYNIIRSMTRRTLHQSLLADVLASAVLRRVRRHIAKSADYNAALATALGRFLVEWSQIARPLLVARACTMLHLAAAAVGIGLVAGLYLRGIVFDFRAGWESTFLSADTVRALLAFIYAPASALTGIAIPDTTHIAAIRLADGAGGERATTWIHLLAATVLLYVVLPRLLLATWQVSSVLRHSLRVAVPGSLNPYYRAVYGDIAGGQQTVSVLPYHYEPYGGATAALRSLLSAAFGERLVITLHANTRYGEEELFAEQLDARHDDGVDVVALLFNLAATPEEENHGVVLRAARDWLQTARSRTRLLVLVDERPYASRVGATDGRRLQERRESWRSFIAAHGLEGFFVSLNDAEPIALERAAQLRAAAWQAA